MTHKQPPFTITPDMLDTVLQIGQLAGRLATERHLSANPTLRRSNRIRTIHGSLAIEQNTLSLEQVTAVLGGKRVLAPPKDIAEVQNAYEVYDRLAQLDPFSVEDLLLAHGIMTRGLLQESGEFRSRSVGVVDANGRVLHFGTLPQYVPELVTQLLAWARDSELPMLIRSCVVHYELEVIHPFADGNGRMGRLWHTLLLSQWEPLFAWMPVESIVHDRQQEYYDAINRSNEEGGSTSFIRFMLSAILEALTEAAQGEHMDIPGAQEDRRWRTALEHLRAYGIIRNADLCRLLQVSTATATRLLGAWVREGKLERSRAGSVWIYKLK